MIQHGKIRKKLNTAIIIFGILSFFTLIFCVGQGGILNDLDSALEEIEDLEKKDLLNNPPPNISSIAKREIELVHNSAGLKKYIKEVENSNIETYFIIFTLLFFLSLILRIVAWLFL